MTLCPYKDENCYLQVFLRECKNIEKKNMNIYIKDNLEFSSDNSYEE